MNKAALKQQRKAYTRLINENPTTVEITRQPTTTGPSGQTVPDPYGTPTRKSATVRVAHERSVISKNDSTPVGIGTNLTRYLLWEYNVDIQEGDYFPELGAYSVGKIDPLIKFGGTYGYQAQLIERNI